MLKKIFTICNWFALACSSVAFTGLTSCGSDSTEESQTIGVMTLADLSSGREIFLIRNASFRFFFITSTGSLSSGEATSSNEVLLEGVIDVDGELFPVNMVYTTDEQQQPDGIPTSAVLEISLANGDDASNNNMITAVYHGTGIASNSKLTGEPIVLTYDFNTGLGVMQSTVESSFNYVSADGNIYIGVDTDEDISQFAFSVVPSSTQVP